ncbi:MAG: tetratricopeptide repeat protein [Acidobacteria bacterium]|nr:tetratricopeptide repeat protein [Acidobacteriota bacterium]
MDSKHRHELKQNEFAIATMTVADRLAEHRKTILGVVGVVAVLAVIAGGVMAYRTRQANAAGAALGVAMATAEAQVIPAPTLPGATQTPGTFPTAQARAEAAIKAFTDVTTAYPGTEAARVASFHLASQLLAGGKAAEAEQAYAALATEDGNTLRGQSAKLGQAEALMALGRTDDALKIYTDLAAVRDGALPADGLLMQLGRASQRAGKTAEARAAFQRVVDEFPESGFVPAAQQQIAAMN